MLVFPQFLKDPLIAQLAPRHGSQISNPHHWREQHMANSYGRSCNKFQHLRKWSVFAGLNPTQAIIYFRNLFLAQFSFCGHCSSRGSLLLNEYWGKVWVHFPEKALRSLALLTQQQLAPSLSISLSSTLGQGKEEGSILYSDRRSGQIPIENTSAWQLLDYLTLISLPPSIHSNHWLHFSIYFTINASGLTEQSSDESMAQSISPAPQVLVRVCSRVRSCASMRVRPTKWN